MEIQRVSDSGLKLKTKNASFLVDTQGKEDEVLVFTNPPSDYSAFSSLVISGAGEYEVSGVSIKGEDHAGKTSYDFLDENQKILITTISQASDIKGLEEYLAIVIIADEAVGEKLGEIAAEIIILVAPTEFLPADTSSITKADKINTKKLEEYKGTVVHLSK